MLTVQLIENTKAASGFLLLDLVDAENHLVSSEPMLLLLGHLQKHLGNSPSKTQLGYTVGGSFAEHA